MKRHLARLCIAVLASSLLTAPAVADGVKSVTLLVPQTKAIMALTGNVKLMQRGGVVTAIVFHNGSLQLTPLAGDSNGGYRVSPPANPIMSNWKHLCAGTPATFVWFAFGIRGSVSFSVFQGKTVAARKSCGDFNYSTPD
jgi:hypothetical protein